MNFVQITFGKDKTLIIKGIAIVFMILLHVFGGAGWYENDLPMNHNEGLIRFMRSLQICVGIFVFMIGYGYAFSKDKDWKYSFRHIKQLLIAFWAVLFLFALPAGYNSIVGGKELILNMFGVEETLTWVSWFVYLYIWAMIVMPFFGRLIDRKPYFWTAVLAFASYSALVVIHELVPEFGKSDFWHPLFVCFSWTPTILLGYLFARKEIFQKLRIPNHWLVTVAAIVLIPVVLYLKMVFPGIKILNFDIVYAPMIITCILVIFTQYKMEVPSKILSELGDKSVYMWFVHALFFTAATRPVYHRFVMISDNLWIIAIWTIVLSYICSAVIKKIVVHT